VHAGVAIVAAVALAAGLPVVTRCPGDAPAKGLNRYVSPHGSNGSDGSRARPWRTIQYAASRVRAGDTVHVAPGRYRGPLTISRGGTSGAPVRFVASRPWRARIAARADGPVEVVQIHADHVTFDGFDVTGSGGDGTVGIAAEGDHDAVVGNHVHDLVVACSGPNGGAGIGLGGGAFAAYRNHDARVDGNVVERIGTGPLDGSCRTVHGIYASVPRVTIVNNVIYRAIGDGITSWHAASSLTVANNLSMGNGGAGILIGSGDTGATGAGNVDTLVSNNILYRNASYGIADSSDAKHPVGPGNRYLNNLTFANRLGAPGPAPGLILYPGQIASGNRDADPRFVVRTPGASREYRLQPTSPAVDAGTCIGAPREAFDGAPRFQGRAVDIGPEERSSTRRRC
jgi:hypothetical protein